MYSYSHTFNQILFKKFLWESGFSNFGLVTIFAKRKFVFWGHFETKHCLNVQFADLWLS